jgi:predicted RNase H-like nuclease (RuvC/YqgF family)
LSDSPELLKPNAEVTESGLHNELGNLKTENEALRQELAKQKQDYAAQLAISKQFNQQVQDLRLQLETERADREEIEGELSELKQNFVPAATLSEKLTPDAATILSQLRAKRKKSPVSLADIEAILEIIEES